MKFLIPIFILVLSSCKKDSPIQIRSLTKNVEVLLKNLEIPWGMKHLPNGDLLFNERNGRINMLKKNATTHDVLTIRSGLNSGEGGLLGLAIDPDFSLNSYFFIYETVDTFNRIVRMIIQENAITQDKIILDSIPAAKNHNGGVIDFGPDGYLYIGTGDAGVPTSSQDKTSLAGKILRIDNEGNAASGNPFGNEIWTYGHRNVQGFDWNVNGVMIATEHGPSGEFGWCCNDEINLIKPGKNYGWPLAIGGNETDTLTPPIYTSGWGDTWAPSGGIFITGDTWGDWKDNFILAGLRGQRLIRFVLTPDAMAVVTKIDTLEGVYYRLRNIIQAPDGSLLFSSSNTVAGPGQPILPGDDKIYRMHID